ncbi:MAG: hypothetical protein K2Z81_22710, partial [Cyanobacteria bacterium]|nr:hypothetical protein [Cyanobacteriota bacterium]
MSFNRSVGNSDNRTASPLSRMWRGLLLAVALVLPAVGISVPFVKAATASSTSQEKPAPTAVSLIEKAVAEEQVSRGLKEVDDQIASAFSTDKERTDATEKLFQELENKGQMPEVVKQFVLERFGRFDKDEDGFIAPEEIRQALKDKPSGFLTRTQKCLLDYIDRHSLSIARCVNDENSFEDCISRADVTAYARDMAGNITSMPTAAGKHTGKKMTVEGAERTYDMYVPTTYDGKSAVPLVVALHGAFEDAATMEYRTGFNAKAEREGFIVIYPEARTCVSGRGRTWNIGSSIWWTVDDVEYVETVIKTARQKFNVDSKRIFVAGFSNGAMLAHEVGTRLSHVLAGVGAVSGSMNGSEKVPAQPVSVIIIHGTKDDVVPIGGKRCFIGYWFFTMKSTDYAEKFWTDHCKTDNLVHSKTASGVKEELHQSA